MNTFNKFLQTFFISILTMTADGQNYITQKEFAQKLYAEKICSGTNHQKLLNTINNNKLKDKLHFLNYCDNATVIYPKKYPENPEEYLEQIHRDVAKLLQDFMFTDFKFQIVLDSSVSDNESKFYRFIVSLRCNGKTYRQKSFYHLYSVSKNKYFGNKIDQQEFYKIFNKILSDLQSPFRLHEVKSYSQDAVDWDRFGIIALTKEQAGMLHGGGVLFMPSYENFKNTLTSKRIDTAIAEYKKIGLLSHLSSEQIKLAIDKVSQQENMNLNAVLQCFPATIMHFDTELGNLQNPYAELLEEFSQISKGAFKPTKIIDNFTKPTNKKTLLKFTINGREYAKQLQVQEDWIDLNFFELVSLAVTDNKLNGQFYDLYTGGQDARVVYLTQQQYNYIRANKLLIFADEWQIEE